MTEEQKIEVKEKWIKSFGNPTDKGNDLAWALMGRDIFNWWLSLIEQREKELWEIHRKQFVELRDSMLQYINEYETRFYKQNQEN